MLTPRLRDAFGTSAFQVLQKEWEDQLKDPDDVFFAAKNRKGEVREQMKDLQRRLDRMKSKKKKDQYAKGRHPGSDRYAAAEVPQRQFSYSHCCICPATSRYYKSIVAAQSELSRSSPTFNWWSKELNRSCFLSLDALRTPRNPSDIRCPPWVGSMRD